MFFKSLGCTYCMFYDTGLNVHLSWLSIFVIFLTDDALAMCYFHEHFLELAPLEVG